MMAQTSIAAHTTINSASTSTGNDVSMRQAFHDSVTSPV